MLSNNIKYKFDFGNTFKLFISYIVEIIENMGIIILTWIAIISLSAVILDVLPDCFVRELIIKIFTAITVIIDSFCAVLIFIPKRVLLTEDKIVVYRFCFPLQVTFWDIRGLNDRILYSQITLCQKHVSEVYLGVRKPFFCVNNNSLVEIRTKYKDYLLPIKDYESFICEVNKRINENSCSNSVKTD